MIVTITLNAAIDKKYDVNEMKVGVVNRVSDCIYGAGGKGLNVARVATIGGEEVIASGFVGGHNGRLIEDLAQRDQICTDFVHTKRESRTCINILDVSTGIHTELLEPGEPVVEDEVLAMYQKFDDLLTKANVITISGSAPLGVAPDSYEILVNKAKAAGVPVLVDTSGAFLEQTVKAKPTLIKPNQDEIEQLMNCKITGETELIDYGVELHNSGIPYVVISLGAKGSVMITSEGVYKAEIPKIEVCNTVGSGDSMLAGLAIGLKREWTPEEMLRYASAVASANALRKETGYYIKEDLEHMLTQVQITKVR